MRISTQTNGFSPILEKRQIVSLLAEAGFTALDFSITKEFRLNMPYNEFVSIYKDLAEHIKSLGMIVGQTHSPFYPSHAEQMRRYDEIIEIQKRAIEATALLGCKYVVIHALKPPERIYDDAIEETFELNKQYFGALKDTLEEFDVNVCIENLYGRDKDFNLVPSSNSTAEETLMYMERLGDRFYACLDTGHTNLVYQSGCKESNLPHMINLLGDRLKVLHVNDNDGFRDLHNAPYLGTINWEEFISSMKKINYTGTLNVECSTFVNKINRDDIQDGLKMLYMSSKRLADAIANE